MDMKIAMIFEAIDDASTKMDAMMQATEQYGRTQINTARDQIQHHKEARHALAAEAVEVAGLGYGFLTLTNAASEFESQMAGVNKVTQFHDQDTAIAALGDRILSLSTDIPMTAAEIATLIESAGQAGLIDSGLSDEEQLAAYTRYAELSGQIGTAFDISAQQAGETATLWMKTWGLAEDQVIDLADATNHLSNNLSASAPQILDILQRQGGFVRATTGMAEAEIAALSASFAAASPNAEIAATSMKNFVSAMTEGAAAPKAQIAAFAALGFSATDLAERMQTDAKGAILDVFAAIEDAPDALRSSLLTEAFGSESIGAIATLAANTDALAYSFELIEDPAARANSFLNEYLVQAGTTAAQQDRFMNGMKQLQITIGTALIPILIELMEAASPLLRDFTAWVQANPELIAQIAKIAVGLMAAKAATIPLRYGWHLLMGGFAHGRLAIGLTIALIGRLGRVVPLAMRGAQLGARLFALSVRGMAMASKGAIWAFRGIMIASRALAASLAANPIALIIGAIAAAAFLIYRNWQGVLAFFARLWQSVVNVFVGAWDVIAGLFTGDSQRMINGLSQIWSGITGIMTAPFEIAWGTVAAIFAEFGIQLGWDPLSVLRGVWDGVQIYIVGLWNGIVDYVRGIWDIFAGIFTGDSQRIIAGLSSAWAGVTAIITAPFEAAWAAIGSLFESFGFKLDWKDIIGPLDIRSWFDFSWRDVLPDWNWSGIIPDLPDLKGMFGDADQSIDVRLENRASTMLGGEWAEGIELVEQYRAGIIALEEVKARLEVTASSGTGLFDSFEVNRAQDMLALLQDIEDTKARATVAPTIESPQTLIEASRVAEDLAKAYPALTAAAQATQSEVTQTISAMGAQLDAVDYSYHGSRFMETLAAGIVAGKHFVTGAIGSVLAEAREYLPSSPAKRGPLSDIHRLKFMETIASSINPAPLLDAIGSATSLARGAMDMVVEPVAIGGTGGNPVGVVGGGLAASNDTFAPKIENHYHGNVDEAVVKAGNDDLMRQLETWWKKKQDEKKRRGY